LSVDNCQLPARHRSRSGEAGGSVVYLKNETFGTKNLGIVDFGIGGLGIIILGTLALAQTWQKLTQQR